MKNKMSKQTFFYFHFFIIAAIASVLLCGCAKTYAPEETPEVNGREEIIFRVGAYGVWLQNQVADYNRQSENYEVVVEAAGKGEDVETFRSKTILDLTSGNGADIFCVNALPNMDATSSIEKNVFDDTTAYLNNQTEVLKQLIDCQRIQGKTYGIPLSFDIYTMSTGLEVPYTREEWNYQNALNLAKRNDVDYISYQPIGWSDRETGLVALSLLGGGEGQFELFYDKQKRTCNFDSKEFIDLLQYINEHLDYRRKNGDSVTAYTALTFQNFDSFEAISPNDVTRERSFVGFPTSAGGTHYLTVFNLYINAQSNHKEGVYDFIDFLLSGEQQQKFKEESDGCFSVRKDVLTEQWDEAKKVAPTKYIRKDMLGNTLYQPRPLTEQEEQLFWYMLDHSKQYATYTPIELIIQEEAIAYFEGNCSAELAAKNIQSRVKLFLNEQ